ncbi:leucine-rich repeat domain-containing protein [Phthorimaea operculella]|nr:leucine-rich repeat domain-containing protein [Phthorimaea operculella]
MEEKTNETLDLSRRGLKKLEKAAPEEGKTISNLVLDQNELQRLDNIDTYSRVENLSICNNFLLRMHGVSRLTNIRVLALNNNGILQIEGLKDLIYLKVLKLAGNNIKSIEHLNNNMHLEHLDLSNNQISFIADISYLKSLKHLNLERNRIVDLRQCDRLPSSLEHLGLSNNNIQDLNEISHLVHLNKLDSITVQGNSCVAMAGKDKLGFDYRPFVLNWIMSVKSIDGFVVSAIESLKAEWLYSQGKGRHFHAGQHQELCDYLAQTCPLTADALETEDQRKLRLILSKAQHHQQQLKTQANSPHKSRLHSPRMQSRIAARHAVRSPDRLTSSYHAALSKPIAPAISNIAGAPSVMSQSFDSPGLFDKERDDKENTAISNIAGAPSVMSQSFDSPGLFDKERDDKENTAPAPVPSKPANQALEAASKMVPVPESLMSPDYQDPLYDIRASIPKPAANHSASSQSSNSSVHEDRPRQSSISRRIGSPKLPKSAASSPKLRSKMEQQRKGSLTSVKNEEKKMNGVAKNEEKDQVDSEKLEIIKLASNQRRQKKLTTECMAAVTIQKMWRGYRSRNLNKDTLRILHAIQQARASQHIQRLTCDMEATKAALESERKIQQLQMQAINALWKKVSTLQTADTQKKGPESEENSEVLRQLTETCFSLQAQVVQLQGCMQEVLKAVAGKHRAEPRATQTDIIAVTTPQEERCVWLKRPQSLPLEVATPPAPPPHIPAATPLAEVNAPADEVNAPVTEAVENVAGDPVADSVALPVVDILDTPLDKAPELTPLKIERTESEERCVWLKRPQSLPLEVATPPAPPPHIPAATPLAEVNAPADEVNAPVTEAVGNVAGDPVADSVALPVVDILDTPLDKAPELTPLKIERTESVIQESTTTERQTIAE